MKHLSIKKAQKEFDACCDMVCDKRQAMMIIREEAENVVLMPESDYHAIMENLYVRTHTTLYDGLIERLRRKKNRN